MALNWPEPKPESWATRLTRWKFNLAPVYRGTGARITHIAGDWRDTRIRLPLSMRTRNYVGTIYGGSMYAAVDPFYMVMLINVLGKGYIVWDKAATIRFLKPGKSTLYARFTLDDTELEAIRTAMETERSIDRVYTVRLTDEQGVVCAEVEKVIYFRRKSPAPAAAESDSSAANVHTRA
jgi:acyl-coenzyme A thioesterase PaaI-like protein